ncbi:MAG: glycosyltransferase family 4 protein [Magnetococcales bacterium]|nr:glycosyltransferase family 4 protein [Magnetococcales bacterium]
MTPRILTFSTLFPNRINPNHGIFVGERLKHLLDSGEIESRVVAPVPWFPVTHPGLNPYAWMGRRVPSREGFHRGVEVLHPRYFLVPKLGMTTAPFFLAAGALPAIRACLREGFDFDLIDAHYFYPDGVAAWLLGAHFGKPVVITGRGSDLNQIPRHLLPGQLIRHAARQVAGLVTVSASLKTVLTGSMGIPEEKVVVLRNGVDLERFSPGNREAARRRLGLTRPTLLSVGYLIDRKGHDLIIRALDELPEMELLIVGEGPERGALQTLANNLGLAHRVRLVGALPQEALPDYYTAADLLVLASDREGWANVMLESMACGTRVAATNVWGAPEAITTPEAGLLIQRRTPGAIALAVRELGRMPADPQATRRHAQRFSWEATTRGQLALFRDIVQKNALA